MFHCRWKRSFATFLFYKVEYIDCFDPLNLYYVRYKSESAKHPRPFYWMHASLLVAMQSQLDRTVPIFQVSDHTLKRALIYDVIVCDHTTNTTRGIPVYVIDILLCRVFPNIEKQFVCCERPWPENFRVFSDFELLLILVIEFYQTNITP